MVSVLIPAAKHRHGVVLADAPCLCEHEIHHADELRDDCPVWAVPMGALQALLRRSSSFAAYEKRFGQVSDSERAGILALFSLIEHERTFDEAKLRSWRDWIFIKHKKEREEAHVKHALEESDAMARRLSRCDTDALDRGGAVRSIANTLSGGILRVWRDERSDILAPGILVNDFREALHVLLLLNLASPESLAQCGKCGKQFTRTKVTQQFCSLRCGNNARKTRQRLKQKGATSGPHKTR
jgi:hypothetical protein